MSVAVIAPPMKRQALFLLLCALPLALHAQLMEDPELRDRVDQSIDRGLRFLAETQREDGTFPGENGATTAVPALAGMAFLSKGYVPGEGPYGEAINRSIDFILKSADMSEKARFKGYLGYQGNGRMYAHSIATLFLSEVSGMVDPERQKRIDEILPCAAKVILDAQARQKRDEQDRGGWRYQPDSGDSDMSCSGWALMALRSVRLNGGTVPDEAIEKAVSYIKRSQSPDKGGFVYRRQEGNNYITTLTGAGILCLELCGKHNDPASLRAARFLSHDYRNLVNQAYGFYGLYYTAQGLFQIGGDLWKEFSAWMYDTWIPRQRPDGAWDKNEVSPYYATSMCVLAFTVPYRQLPIYQRDETVDEN